MMSSHVVLGNPASRGAGVFFDLKPADDPRHLLGLDGMSREAIVEILDRAERYRAAWKNGARVPAELSGVEIVNAFFEDSTRTRVSFELAEKRLGAVSVSISENGSSISKGESLLDTVRTL